MNMKQISENQRMLNIISAALKEGYTFSRYDKFEDVLISAEEYLFEEATVDRYEYNAVSSRGDSYSWADGLGYYNVVSGQIDFSNKSVLEEDGTLRDLNQYESPYNEDGTLRDDIVCIYDKMIDSEGKVVVLYC